MAESAIPAIAVLSLGRWCALCPTDTNAILLTPGQTRFECTSSTGLGADGTTADVQWPADVAAIEASVAGLPIEQQNWMPT